MSDSRQITAELAALSCADLSDAMDRLRIPGQVVVPGNHGRLDAAVWGDLLTATASRRNVAGTVMDGVCRDVQRDLTPSYPIFSRGGWMRIGKDRVQVEAAGEPVAIGGVRAGPGDWLRGDTDGVVSVPATRIEEVIETAKEVTAAGDRFRRAVEDGLPRWCGPASRTRTTGCRGPGHEPEGSHDRLRDH